MTGQMALHGTESRLTRLETQMESVASTLTDLRKLVIWGVILSALALGSRAIDIAQTWIGKH